MNKSTFFLGQSVFGQLISLLDKKIIADSVFQSQSDYRTKRFNTKDHLISMLFTAFSNSTSLREVSSAMLGLKGKTEHFQLKHIPYRSTLSDTNKKRSEEVFSKIYYGLYKKHKADISDSRKNYDWEERIEIIDSTTIGLFKDILECVGRKPSNGKSKGGIKVHTQLNLQQRVPKIIWYSSAAVNDHTFLKRVELKKNQIAFFDKGYNDYKAFDEFTEKDIFFVTRLKSNAAYTSKKELDIPTYIDDGVIKDELITVEIKENNRYIKTLTVRKVSYWDDVHKRCFEFITNLFGMNAGHIALIYKQRWQIAITANDKNKLNAVRAAREYHIINELVGYNQSISGSNKTEVWVYFNRYYNPINSGAGCYWSEEVYLSLTAKNSTPATFGGGWKEKKCSTSAQGGFGIDVVTPPLSESCTGGGPLWVGSLRKLNTPFDVGFQYTSYRVLQIYSGAEIWKSYNPSENFVVNFWSNTYSACLGYNVPVNK